jgi:hypothetical protein
MAGAAITTMMIIDIVVDERGVVEGQTSGSKIDPIMVLDGTGEGTFTCGNEDSDNSISPSSSSSAAAQISFNALGYPRGTHADIIGGGIVKLYSNDISMEGSTGSGSIDSEAFTLQIDRAIVKCPFSASLTPVGDVLITGKCGNSVQFSAKDIAEPFQFDGTFRGDVLCISSTGHPSNVQLTDICPALTGRDSDGDGIDDSCDPTPFLDLDGDGVGDEREELDNCPSVYNPDQSDRDRNEIGDVCDLHPPGSGLMDPDKDFMGDQQGEMDNCPDTYNPDQKDIDHDGIGEVCDPHPSTAPVHPGQQPVIQSQQPQQSSPDRDHDNIPDNADNCADIRNENQRDSDRDKHGDVCDNAPNVPNPDQADTDNDGIGNVADKCPKDKDKDQKDKDKDGIGDVCDSSSGPGKQGQPPGQQKGPPGKPPKP